MGNDFFNTASYIARQVATVSASISLLGPLMPVLSMFITVGSVNQYIFMCGCLAMISIVAMYIIPKRISKVQHTVGSLLALLSVGIILLTVFLSYSFFNMPVQPGTDTSLPRLITAMTLALMGPAATYYYCKHEGLFFYLKR